MFLGTHTPKLDEKGRLTLPAKFREELADGLVITRAQDRCLAIYPVATFVEMTTSIQAAPASVKQVRDFQRMLAAGASDETPDKQGRITIPPQLRSYAGLDGPGQDKAGQDKTGQDGTGQTRDCVVVGAMNRVEVWNTAAWEHYSTEQESAFAEMNGEVFPGM